MKTATDHDREWARRALGEVDGETSAGGRESISFALLRRLLASADRCAELEQQVSELLRANQELREANVSHMRSERQASDAAMANLQDLEQSTTRVAELERFYAAQCRENIALQAANDRLRAALAESEGYLQQSKDDYELALRENEKLRAGLEKVRALHDEYEDLYFDSNHIEFGPVRKAMAAALDLAGVDHEPTNEERIEEEIIADSDYAAHVSPYGFGE